MRDFTRDLLTYSSTVLRLFSSTNFHAKHFHVKEYLFKRARSKHSLEKFPLYEYIRENNLCLFCTRKFLTMKKRITVLLHCKLFLWLVCLRLENDREVG